MYSSNFADKVGVWGSNYARDKIGMYRWTKYYQ